MPGQPVQVSWGHVQSHSVKTMNSGMHKACVALRSLRRWACTGTPIATDVTDLQGQFAALHLEPYGQAAYFTAHMKHALKPAVQGIARQTAFYYNDIFGLMYFMKAVTIRHMKSQVLGGAKVLELPPKTEVTVDVQLNAVERAAYVEVYRQAKARFDSICQSGPTAISSHMIEIMSLLSPLRRICSGGNMRTADLAVPIVRGARGKASLPEDEATRATEPGAKHINEVAPEQECAICLECPLEQPMKTPCNHWFCKECITGYLVSKPKCPMCRQEVQQQQLMQGQTRVEQAARAEAQAAQEASIAEAGKSAADGPSSSAAAGADVVSCTSKLDALIQQLKAMQQADPKSKALVFSQFKTTLDWLQAKLPEHGFGYRTITGSMPLLQRKKAIEAFQADPPTTVFLLSVRSGSVGITLTAADHVFFLEPLLNPALAEQAIGRAWRMGQTKPVKVMKLVVPGSVEQQIVEVVHGRQHGIGASAHTDNGKQHNHIKAQSIAGCIKSDNQNLRASELTALFKPPSFMS